LILVDAGSEPAELTARLWQLAHTILLVTSPEAAAVMDAYSLLKRLLNDQPLRNAPTLVVSQAASGDQAADVHRRIDQSTRRFLGLPVSLGGFVPLARAGAADVGGPAPQAKAIGELAKQLVAHMKPGSQPLAA
jgi:MinD-like ATPase involved in chromosome partitioning or flagellar assembly